MQAIYAGALAVVLIAAAPYGQNKLPPGANSARGVCAQFSDPGITGVSPSFWELAPYDVRKEPSGSGLWQAWMPNGDWETIPGAALTQTAYDFAFVVYLQHPRRRYFQIACFNPGPAPTGK